MPRLRIPISSFCSAHRRDNETKNKKEEEEEGKKEKETSQ